jgi:hypothetical protein
MANACLLLRYTVRLGGTNTFQHSLVCRKSVWLNLNVVTRRELSSVCLWAVFLHSNQRCNKAFCVGDIQQASFKTRRPTILATCSIFKLGCAAANVAARAATKTTFTRIPSVLAIWLLSVPIKVVGPLRSICQGPLLELIFRQDSQKPVEIRRLKQASVQARRALIVFICGPLLELIFRQDCQKAIEIRRLKEASLQTRRAPIIWISWPLLELIFGQDCQKAIEIRRLKQASLQTRRAPIILIN